MKFRLHAVRSMGADRLAAVACSAQRRFHLMQIDQIY